MVPSTAANQGKKVFLDMIYNWIIGVHIYIMVIFIMVEIENMPF